MLQAAKRANPRPCTTVEFGASPELKDRRGYTPLGLAAYHGNTAAVLMLLLCAANVDSDNGNRQTPYMIARMFGHDSVAIALLAAGADPNARTISGDTAESLANLMR